MANAHWKHDRRRGTKVLIARWRDPRFPGGQVEERRPNDRTREAASKYAQEMERLAERITKGLEVEVAPRTFGDLLDDWWEREGRRRRSDSKHGLLGSIEKHLGDLRAEVLTPGTAPAFADTLASRLDDKVASGQLSEQTVNHLRSVVYRCFEIARDPKVRKWRGENPIRWVKRKKVPKKRPLTLSPEEVPRVLAAYPEPRAGAPWRWACAMSIYTGARPGEVFGLRKADVNLGRGVVTLRNSWANTTPKDGEERTVILTSELRPHLEAAIKAAKGTHVFPREDGSPFSEGIRFNLVDHLRRACAAAGVVVGYDHTCRRCKARARKEPAATATTTWRHEDAAQRTCPACGMKLWIKPIPLPLRYYDLRHTAGTILRQRHVDLGAVQRLLGHSSADLTAAVYDHSRVEDYREDIDRALTFNPSPPRPAGAPNPVTAGAQGAPTEALASTGSDDFSPSSNAMRAVSPGAQAGSAVGVQVVARSNRVAPTSEGRSTTRETGDAAAFAFPGSDVRPPGAPRPLPSAVPSFLEACAKLAGLAAERGDFDKARALIDKAARVAALRPEVA